MRAGGSVPVDGPLVTNDLSVLLGAAIDGLGITLLPRDFVVNELSSGQLVQVLDDEIGMAVTLSLVWLEREFLDPKVRAFVDLAVEWAENGRMGPMRELI